MNSARVSSATMRAPSFSNAATTAGNSSGPGSGSGPSGGKVLNLQPRTMSKVGNMVSTGNPSTTTSINTAIGIGAHKPDVRELTENRPALRTGGDMGEGLDRMRDGTVRDGSMQLILSELSAIDSDPELKYRAIRQSKLVAYDDAKVFIGRNPLRDGANDGNLSLDRDRWSQKEVQPSWTLLPGQKLNRWNKTM